MAPRRTWIWAIPAAVLLVGVGAAGALLVPRLTAKEAPPADTGPTLAAAYRECDQVGQLGDGGKTLVLDGLGKDRNSGSLSVQQEMCVLNAIDTPSYVTAAMQQTRALDGRQSQTWGNFQASWTYHPDDGLDVVLRETK
jgi:hypothetical protein